PASTQDIRERRPQATNRRRHHLDPTRCTRASEWDWPGRHAAFPRSFRPERGARMRMTPILIRIPMLLSPAAQPAPIVIVDRGTHNVGSSASTYVLQNGILIILPGSEAMSVSAHNFSGDSAAASVRMTGGQVDAGIDINRGSLDVSGGLARGFDSSLYG